MMKVVSRLNVINNQGKLNSGPSKYYTVHLRQTHMNIKKKSL